MTFKDGNIGMDKLSKNPAQNKIRKSVLVRLAENYRLIAEHTTDLIGIIDVHGVVQYASPSHRAVIGINPEDFVGQIALEHVHPEDVPLVLGRRAEIVKTKQPAQGTFRYIHKNGSSVIIEGIYTPILGVSGEVENILVVARDITERRHAEDRLVQSQQRYKSLFDSNLDAVYEFDLDGCYVDSNKAFEDIFGYSCSELRGMHFLQIVAPEDAEKTRIKFDDVTRGETVSIELQAFHKSGNRLLVQVVVMPVWVNGEITGGFGIAKDISSPRYSQELLKNQKQVLEMIAKGSTLEEVLNELTKVVEYHAPSSMCTVFLLEDDNRTLKYIAGHQQLKAYIDECGPPISGPGVGACGTASFLNKVVVVDDIMTDPLYDNYRHIALRYGLRSCFATPLVSPSGEVVGTFGMYYPTTKRPSSKEIELIEMISHITGLAIEHSKVTAGLTYLAHYDPLTGLPNRTLFFKHLSEALMHAQAGNNRVAIMFLDLDHFKSINDSLGHQFGDRILQVVAQRVQKYLESNQALYRMGGDEFMILLTQVNDEENVTFIAERVLSSFDRCFVLDGNQHQITASLGIAMFPKDAGNADILIRNADVAMYEAKLTGNNKFQFYNPYMIERVNKRLMIESALRRAIEHQEFTLFYQPRMDIRTNTITSVEALLRWNKPDEGIVLPGEFIGVAEETGLIVPIGEWIFHQVCLQIKTWEAIARGSIRIAVNVSSKQLQQPNFTDIVKEIIRETSIDPRFLEIEVTESGLIDNQAEAFELLRELRTLGITISIDDFGVGYSSLNRLKDMPVDNLKIDRSFIRDMFQDDGAITKTIIILGHNFNLTVIAEGVETEQQFVKLREYGCDEIQGYYLSAPISATEFNQRYVVKT